MLAKMTQKWQNQDRRPKRRKNSDSIKAAGQNAKKRQQLQGLCQSPAKAAKTSRPRAKTPAKTASKAVKTSEKTAAGPVVPSVQRVGLIL
jgi:hypothetical protein